MARTLEEKIMSGRQYRMMKFECREETNPDKRAVEGYATTYNEPYTLYEDDEYRFIEQVSPDAFNECDTSDVIMQYDHEGRVFARISNGTLSLESDEHGLLVRADLGGTEIGRQLYEEIKGGYTNKMSFGFTVEADEQKRTKGDDGKVEVTRTITKVRKLYDVSAVSLPANDGTEISARKYGEGVIAGIRAERLEAEEEERRIKTEQDERARKLALLTLA